MDQYKELYKSRTKFYNSFYFIIVLVARTPTLWNNKGSESLTRGKDKNNHDGNEINVINH
jgi:hypothetical protein